MINPKLYKFYFDGVDLPFIVLATNQDEARERLAYYHENESLPQGMTPEKLVSESVESLVAGITTRNHPLYGEMVWVGYELMPTGWMVKEQYKNYLQNRNSQK
jgi:hypothetical protein